MASTARQVESKALRLPTRERARLAERLILSLDEQTDPDAEKLWAEEAERRLDELRSGRVKSRAAESVFRKARSTLR
jgi:putative addiction module component (TIGR02574 family)